MILPEKYLTAMRARLGDEFNDFLASYDLPQTRGLLLNTLRMGCDEFINTVVPKISPLSENPLAKNGFVIDGDADAYSAHPYHRAGLYYMQEPSAMSVAQAAFDKPYLRVLDMCAAPGGKTAGLAAAMQGRGVLVSNDFVFKRALELRKNIERLGAANAVVTSLPPKSLADTFPGYFDLVVVDAPCSGEGMFRKDATAIAEWSEEHVKTCAKRQNGILSDAGRAVAPGGRLVYSTCTFETSENEGVVERFLEDNSDFDLILTERLYPHKIRGEGHFLCVMERKGGTPFSPDKPKDNRFTIKPCISKAYMDFMEDCFIKPPECEGYVLSQNKSRGEGPAVFLANEYVREVLLSLVSCGIKPLCAGVEAGCETKGRFEPAHTLFMAAHGGEYRRALDMDAGELEKFLRGEEIPADIENGYCVMRIDGMPLGFTKAVQGQLKNKLPKGLRGR